MDAIASTAFRPPGKLILDRSLNRDRKALASLFSFCRTRYPEVKLELLANEGCLPHCPFKPAHDAHIALVNMGLAPEMTHGLNRDFGCRRYLEKEPWRLFQSPFIRPEDLPVYEKVVDVIKICGRTLGTGFLRNAVSAYLRGSHKGNLLDLMDTMEWLAARLSVANHELPLDFLDRLSTCAMECDRCGYCRELFARHASDLEFRLKDLRSGRS